MNTKGHELDSDPEGAVLSGECVDPLGTRSRHLLSDLCPFVCIRGLLMNWSRIRLGPAGVASVLMAFINPCHSAPSAVPVSQNSQ